MMTAVAVAATSAAAATTAAAAVVECRRGEAVIIALGSTQTRSGAVPCCCRHVLSAPFLMGLFIALAEFADLSPREAISLRAA
jgi:hypothetical protein